jgi:hypothetical protein
LLLRDDSQDRPNQTFETRQNRWVWQVEEGLRADFEG